MEEINNSEIVGERFTIFIIIFCSHLVFFSSTPITKTLFRSFLIVTLLSVAATRSSDYSITLRSFQVLPSIWWHHETDDGNMWVLLIAGSIGCSNHRIALLKMLVLTNFCLLYLEISQLFGVSAGGLWTVVPMIKYLYCILVITVQEC
ncbi:hypothetical protein VIGAN_02057900 [Vigna angularis var. angularis]|uniref:Uncharacterized protein n=1 Tax=Vigna angularis var. angularis TaxID=157739 RepID=A0A0S3RBG0_PHAAN|nr:hypothetical protein VIGAN_02057900 [Vigna angularis var. angularis]